MLRGALEKAAGLMRTVRAASLAASGDEPERLDGVDVVDVEQDVGEVYGLKTDGHG